MLETVTSDESGSAPPDMAVPRSRRGEPVWELATFYPPQGEWTEQAYLALETNRLVEFKDGDLEFLPMTYPFHQDVVQFLFLRLHQYSGGRNCGRAYTAPLRVRTVSGRIREPDVLLVQPEHIVDRQQPATGASLVMEVVSGGRLSRDRDLVEKRGEYAAAGVQEYWIVDNETRTIEVLALAGAPEYVVHGRFGEGTAATSRLLPGFEVDVTECFRAGEG
jgi:Uma2 family endonuclease